MTRHEDRGISDERRDREADGISRAVTSTLCIPNIPSFQPHFDASATNPCTGCAQDGRNPIDNRVAPLCPSPRGRLDTSRPPRVCTPSPANGRSCVQHTGGLSHCTAAVHCEVTPAPDAGQTSSAGLPRRTSGARRRAEARGSSGGPATPECASAQPWQAQERPNTACRSKARLQLRGLWRRPGWIAPLPAPEFPA